MTLVVGVNSEDFALITADSRITTGFRNGLRVRADCCQKVFRVGQQTILGFAGDVVAMAGLLKALGRPAEIPPDKITVDFLGRVLPPALRPTASTEAIAC